MKDLIAKYEYVSQNVDIRWLFEDVTKSDRLSKPSVTAAFSETENSLWFINCSFGLQYFEDNYVTDEFYFYTEDELLQKLADWLFIECLNEFRSMTERVLELENDGKYGARIYGKEKLSTLLDLPVSDLEFQLMMSEDQFRSDINVAEGPHYYVPVPDLTELQMFKQENMETLTTNSEPMNGFDLLDRVFQDYGDTELDNKISDIKIELNEFCAGDRRMDNCEDNVDMGDSGEDASRLSTNTMYDYEEAEIIPKLQIIGKHQAQASEHVGPPVHPKRRGRPRK